MNRIRVESGVYHCISRANGRLFLLDRPDAKERFVAMLAKVSAFCSMEVLSFCVMGNHFHVLAREVPVPAEGFDDAELERRLHLLYEPAKARILFANQQAWRRRGDGARADRIREGYRRMTGDVSWFMRLLKQRFSVWYNRTHGREGTLWSERFRSVAVEDSEEAVLAMAAYIDLNPVRAGMVEDPRDYRWSTAGAAAAGSEFARKAIGRVCALAWERVAEGALARERGPESAEGAGGALARERGPESAEGAGGALARERGPEGEAEGALARERGPGEAGGMPVGQGAGGVAVGHGAAVSEELQGEGGAEGAMASKGAEGPGSSGGVDGAGSAVRAAGSVSSESPEGADGEVPFTSSTPYLSSTSSASYLSSKSSKSSLASASSMSSAVVEWEEAEAWWRGRLAEAAGEVRDDEGRIVRRGMDEGARARLAAGDGPVGALMRRVRHFARGAAVGSRAFVKGIVEGERGRKLPADRKSEGSRIPGKGLGRLYSLRKLARERPSG